MKEATNVNVMFFHGETMDGYRFTISGLIENDTNLSLGIAVCGDKEVFNKAKGRGISTGRLLNQRRSELGGRVEKSIPSSSEQKDFTRFTEEVAKYNNFTKKNLLKEFGLRRPSFLSEYEQKRIELLKEFAQKLRELSEIYTHDKYL